MVIQKAGKIEKYIGTSMQKLEIKYICAARMYASSTFA